MVELGRDRGARGVELGEVALARLLEVPAPGVVCHDGGVLDAVAGIGEAFHEAGEQLDERVLGDHERIIGVGDQRDAVAVEAGEGRDQVGSQPRDDRGHFVDIAQRGERGAEGAAAALVPERQHSEAPPQLQPAGHLGEGDDLSGRDGLDDGGRFIHAAMVAPVLRA